MWPQSDERQEDAIPRISNLLPEWITKKTRRRKASNGKRKRTSRGQQIKEANEELKDVTTLKSTLAECAGMCAIDSWNLNGWHAGTATAATSTADAILLQESRLEGDEACRRAEDSMRGQGWNAKINRAVKTQAGGVSAGVAIMAKGHVGMDPA